MHVEGNGSACLLHTIQAHMCTSMLLDGCVSSYTTTTCHPLVLEVTSPRKLILASPVLVRPSVPPSLCRMMSSLKQKYSNCTSEFSARTAIFGSCVATYYGNYVAVNGSVVVHMWCILRLPLLLMIVCTPSSM